METIVIDYKSNVLNTLRSYKKLAERALGQMSDEELFSTIDDESNSIAIIIKHISGNQRSRFTDFLTSDGEKPDRNRDTEFTEWEFDRVALMAYWSESWEIVLNEIGALEVEDFGTSVTIRGEAHTVVEAINRQLTHYAYHVGQIVFLAKHFRADAWKSLSVPKGSSNAFNKYLADRKEAGEEQLNPLDGPAEFTKK